MNIKKREQLRQDPQYIETDKHVCNGYSIPDDECPDWEVAEGLFMYVGEGSSVRNAKDDHSTQTQFTHTLNAQTIIKHDGEKRWKRLAEINKGVRETYHESRKIECENIELVRWYGIHVNLPEPFIDVAEEIMKSIDMSNFGRHCKESVILGILYVADKRRIQRRASLGDDPEELYETRVSKRRRFRELMDSVGIDITDLTRLSSSINERFDEEDIQKSVQACHNMMN